MNGPPSPTRSWPALAGRKSGSVRLEHDRLVFSHDEPAHARLELPYAGLEIRVTGENSPHYTLHHPSKPRQELCVQTTELIETLAKMGLKAAVNALSLSSRRLQSRLVRWGAVGGLLGFLFLGVPWMISLLPATWIHSLVTPEMENSIGSLVFPLASGESTQDHPSLAALEKISKKIIFSTPELQGIPIRIHLSRNPAANAFALPGQRIVVNAGLLEEADSWEEVAGVLAHELGHLEQRHPLRKLTGNAGVLLGMGVLSLIKGSDFALWAGRGSNLISLQYGREDEFTADTRGAYFLNQSGIGPAGLIAFLQRDLKRNPDRDRGRKILHFLGTHPSTQERILRLQEMNSGSPATDSLRVLDLPPLHAS